MVSRRGAAKGTGSGYKNLPGFPRDPGVHDQSRMGIKQPQRLPFLAHDGNLKTKILREYDLGFTIGQIAKKIGAMPNFVQDVVLNRDNHLYHFMRRGRGYTIYAKTRGDAVDWLKEEHGYDWSDLTEIPLRINEDSSVRKVWSETDYKKYGRLGIFFDKIQNKYILYHTDRPLQNGKITGNEQYLFDSEKEATAFARQLIQKQNKDKSYDELKKSGVKLNKRGDADGDGVRNAKDCKPLDPSRQDDPVIDITTTGGGIPESAVAKGAGAVLTGTGTLIGGTGRAIGGLGEGVGGLASGVGKNIGERGERAKIEDERMLIKDIDELEQHRLDRQEKERMRVLLQQRRPTYEE